MASVSLEKMREQIGKVYTPDYAASLPPSKAVAIYCSMLKRGKFEPKELRKAARRKKESSKGYDQLNLFDLGIVEMPNNK